MNYTIAILDLYMGKENQGMRNIKQIIEQFALQYDLPVTYRIFDVRGKDEVPAIHDFDVFISTGGPGSPVDSEGSLWEQRYFEFTDALMDHNTSHENKKYLFLICHSFQVFCRHYNYGAVCKRKSPTFGVFPVHKTEAGQQEELFKNLTDPFYIVDSREWQVIQPNLAKFFETGAEVLTIEKERPHVPLERALMAIRFKPEIFGTQFHPEADAIGMRHYLLHDEEKKQQAIAQVGEQKYTEMIDHLFDEEKIITTRSHIIPGFLRKAFIETLVNV